MHTEQQRGKELRGMQGRAQGEGWEKGREDSVGLGSGRGRAGREGL